MSNRMSNEMQIFKNQEFGEVRVVEIDGKPWFVGKDVALALGYGKGKSLANAVNKYVSEKDKGVTGLMTPGGMQKFVIINESGLYSLVLSSRLPTAVKFRHWIMSEFIFFKEIYFANFGKKMTKTIVVNFQSLFQKRKI